MIHIFALFGAAALTAGAPQSPRQWISDRDYPDRSRFRGQKGATAFTLLISPEGQPLKCQVTRSSGYPQLDDRACEALMKRAKFAPSFDRNGSKLHQIYRGSVTFAVAGERNTRLEYVPDIEIEVQRLPKNVGEIIVDVVVQTDEAGRFVDCASSEAKAAPSQIVSIACNQARAIEATIVKNLDGQQIPVIRNLKVWFKAASP